MYLFLMATAKKLTKLLDKFKHPPALSVKITSFSNPHLFFVVFMSLNCNCSGGNEVISIVILISISLIRIDGYCLFYAYSYLDIFSCTEFSQEICPPLSFFVNCGVYLFICSYSIFIFLKMYVLKTSSSMQLVF